jgi:predicted dehydrogenase
MLNVGIVGLGRMGQRHAEQLALHTHGARLVAACSVDASEHTWARERLGVTALYDDYDALLRDPQVQAIAIATPTTLHPQQTIAALEAGKHVFVEKPLALDVVTCERVEAVARALFYASRTLAHGHETSTEVIGTEGSVSVGVGAHRDRVQSRDAAGVHHRVLADFVERFAEAFQREMAAFVAARQGEALPPLTLADATEATRIGVAITKSLQSGQVEAVA